MKRQLLSLFVLSLVFLSACGKATDRDKVAEAQQCLDSYGRNGGSLDACIAKVDGIESKAASTIRCSGVLIAEGFGQASRIKSAMDAVKNGGQAASAQSYFKVMAFVGSATPATNKANATSAKTHCGASGVDGLQKIANMAVMSTEITGGVQDVNSLNLNTALANVAGSPAAQAVVGQAALDIYAESCTNGKDAANGQFCAQFSTAIQSSGGSPQQVGAFLAQCYQTPPPGQCTGF